MLFVAMAAAAAVAVVHVSAAVIHMAAAVIHMTAMIHVVAMTVIAVIHVAVPIALIAVLRPAVETFAAAPAVAFAMAIAAPVPTAASPAIVIPTIIVAAEQEQIHRKRQLRQLNQRRDAFARIDRVGNHARTRRRCGGPGDERQAKQPFSQHEEPLGHRLKIVGASGL